MSATEPQQQEQAALGRLEAEPWFGVGRSTVTAFAERRQWLYRRVERLEFTGARSVRRYVSVDFEVPSDLPVLWERAAPGAVMIPISVFRKWPPLMDFDLCDPRGHPASLYVRDTNKALDFGLLMGTIESAAASAGIPAISAELRRELAVLVASDEPGQLGVSTVVGQLVKHLRPRDSAPRTSDVEQKVAIALDLAGQLGANSILWVPLAGEPGTDRIVKFSYLDEFKPPEEWWKRFLIACSWRERTIAVQLPHAGRSARYHLEMEVPGEGLELMSLQTIGYPSADEFFLSRTRRTRPPPRAGSREATPDERRPEGESTILERRGHVYLAYDPHRSHRITLNARIAPTRAGFVQSCLVAAVAIAAVMSFAFANLSSAVGQLDPTIVLLAAVPVVLGYLLVRPNSHAIERDHIVGVRSLMLLSGLVPILGALALVLAPSDLLEPIWAALLILSWYFVAGLAASWVFAAPRSEGRRKHRWLRIVPASGLLAGLTLLAGTLLCCQPYSHIAPGQLHNYIRHDRALVLGGAALVGVGLAALYTLIGGVWRAVAVRRSEDRRARRRAAWLIVGSGMLFAWTTIGVLTLEAWQALRITHGVQLHHHDLAAFMRVLDTVQNAALVPLLVFMFSSSVYLLLSTGTSQDPPVPASSRVGPRASQPAPEVDAGLVATGLIIGLGLILVRAVLLLWPSDGHAAAWLCWVGFAIWVLAIACALRYRLRLQGGRPRLDRHEPLPAN
jgi:hypothetical protein